MTVTSTLPSLDMLAFYLCGVGVVLSLWRWATDPLRRVPGPFLARWTPFWLMYHARKGERYLAVHELHLKYGPVVRIAPWHVSFASPEAPSKVYAQGSAALDKSPFYRAFYVQGTESLFSTQNRALHSSKRRLLSQPFSYQSIRGFESFMRESLGRFVLRVDRICAGDQFGDAVRPNSVMDVLLWFNYLAFDIISDLAFGEPLGMVDKGSDILPAERKDGTIFEEHAAALIDQRGRTAAVVGLVPSVEEYTKMLPIPFITAGYKSTESLSRIATRCVKHRVESGVTRDDMLERLIEGVREKEGGTVSQDEVVTEAMLLLTAGADTTANSLTAILFYILTNPSIYAKVVAELDSINAGLAELDSTASRPQAARLNSAIELETATDSLPTHEQIKSLPYLNATIEEGLRLFATNAFGLPRIVGEAFELDGVAVPKGYEVSAPAYTIQRDPRIWGEDAEMYRPERWIEDGGGMLKKHMLTFGSGPRACIGKNLAYIQMQLALATVLLRYEFTMPPGTELRSVEGFMHRPLELWLGVKRRGQGLKV
ncbi:Cytochrome P450 [Mycena indigotica]|uniref:Cytochrome P450 n=1 Tax=Mycena indigotica TaxID=2126181 RepID=A0A8H6THT3_9AGAR|nr:Cytochrome P450 [Mycena indigotica]KAF7315985.1 Cytochrome P450 [Mycena indigotica]